LKDRTSLSPTQIISLLNIVLDTTYFVQNGYFYHQIHGVAMGSSVSPVIANLYMESFEQQALRTATDPPKVLVPICG
jgi:hypothetical protein